MQEISSKNSFTHIYREANSQADKLSKESLSMQEGMFAELDFKDNLLVLESLKSIF